MKRRGHFKTLFKRVMKLHSFDTKNAIQSVSVIPRALFILKPNLRLCKQGIKTKIHNIAKNKVPHQMRYFCYKLYFSPLLAASAYLGLPNRRKSTSVDTFVFRAKLAIQ